MLTTGALGVLVATLLFLSQRLPRVGAEGHAPVPLREVSAASVAAAQARLAGDEEPAGARLPVGPGLMESDTEAEPGSDLIPDLIPGEAVFAPYGGRFYYASTVINTYGGRAQVLFEDGDEAEVAVAELRRGALAPGDRCEVARAGAYVSALVERSLPGAYQVRIGRELLLAAPTAIRVAQADARAHPPTPPGPLTVARYQDGALWYFAQEVTRTEDARVTLVYADNDQELGDLGATRPLHASSGLRVQYKAESGWLPATVAERLGRALRVRVQDRVLWAPLSKLRIASGNMPPLPLPSGATGASRD